MGGWLYRLSFPPRPFFEHLSSSAAPNVLDIVRLLYKQLCSSHRCLFLRTGERSHKFISHVVVVAVFRGAIGFSGSLSFSVCVRVPFCRTPPPLYGVLLFRVLSPLIFSRKTRRCTGGSSVAGKRKLRVSKSLIYYGFIFHFTNLFANFLLDLSVLFIVVEYWV